MKANKKKAKSHNSKYYRNKADKTFMDKFHGKACEVCGNTAGTCGHHVIGKSRSKALRYDRRHIIIVCCAHHTFGNEMAQQSVNSLAVERFLEWFKNTHPERHRWIVENERISRRYTYKDAVENMESGREAWEYE